MSGEAHPILSGVVGAFRKLISNWQKMKLDRPELAPFIDEGLYWAELYFEKTGNTRAYSVAIGTSFLWQLSYPAPMLFQP